MASESSPPAAPAVHEAAVDKGPTPPATGAGETRCSELLKAKASFQAFIAKADGRAEYTAALERAQERVGDIDRMLAFMGEGSAAVPCP
jgi:hypothetical protein